MRNVPTRHRPHTRSSTITITRTVTRLNHRSMEGDTP
jgi:hypothetical protein